jgi:hypothetical protein
MPSALAVGTLMTSSNLVDCTTGKSAGLAPLRTRPVYRPNCLYTGAASRRAADEGDELAAPHGLPSVRGSHPSTSL